MIAEQRLARNRLCLAGAALAISKNIKLYLREKEKDPRGTTKQAGPGGAAGPRNAVSRLLPRSQSPGHRATS